MAFDTESIQAELDGRNVLWLEETDSTMRDASRLAEFNCPSGTVVGAERQTAGQGRLGRSWHSAADGLYFSIVLRLDLPSAQLPLVTMTAGLAAAEAIRQFCGAPVDLRWPNDGMIGHRKLFGILVQLDNNALICGIGVNVNQSAFPEDIAALATSLRIVTGKEHSREHLFVVILAALDEHLAILKSQGPSAILSLFTQASSYVNGRRVVVDQGARELRGTTEGLDESGFLRLRLDNGSVTTILAGGVRPA
ncbi:MAG: biotin--[acetyl-CoA-carboxylase] ligase [Acidobacteria bacterium]|nr:biotin--[acetyl-CoA-carboxylase] ligase [Acidobacteriota bacterium]